jgi:hypothetical protein
MKKGNSSPKPAINPQKPINNFAKPAPSANKPATISKPKMGLGFGFGDAMFAMKNLSADYEKVESLTSQPVPVQGNKNPQSSFKPLPPQKLTSQPKIVSFNQGS